MSEIGSTATWNPERPFPWLGDSLPCPSEEEEMYMDGGGSSYLCECSMDNDGYHQPWCKRFGLYFEQDLTPAQLADSQWSKRIEIAVKEGAAKSDA